MEENKPKQTRKRKPRSKGLGDTVEKITTATGIKALVKFAFGEDCGCDKRKDYLNKKFPYFKPNCLTEDEYNYLTKFFEVKKLSIKPTEQNELLKIYNRVLNQKQEPTNCSDCWRDIINKIKTVYDAYENN